MNETQQNKFTERLNQALKKHDISQSDLAQLVGVTKSSINLYVKGKSVPRLNVLNKIAKVLQVKESWLMGYDETDEEPPFEVSYGGYEKMQKEIAIKNFIESTTNVKVEVKDYTTELLENGLTQAAYDLAIEDENSTCCMWHVNGVTLNVTNKEYEEFETELIKFCQKLIKDLFNNKMVL